MEEPLPVQPSNTRRVAVNLLWGLISRVLGLVTGMASVMLMSRHLQPAGYGKYNLALAVVGFAAVFTDFGLNNIAVREMSRNRGERARLFGNLLLLKTVLAVLCLLGVGIFVLWGDMAADIRQAVWIAAFSLFFTTLSSAELIFQVELKLWYPSLVTTVAGLLSLGLIAAGVARGWTVAAFVLIYAGSSLLNGMALLLYAIRLLTPCLRLDLALWKRLVLEAWPVGLQGLAIMAIGRLNMLLLFHFCGAEATGLYGAAVKLPELLQFFPAALMAPAFPLLSEYFVHDQQRLRRVYQRCLDFVVLLAIPFAVGMSLLSRSIVHLIYGPEYVQAVPVLAVVSFQMVGTFMGYVGGYMMIAAGKQRKLLWISVVCAGVSTLLNLLLIPPVAALGAAIVLVGVQAIGTTWTLAAANETIEHRFRGRVLSRTLLASGFMGAVVLCLRGSNLPLAVLVGAIVYLFVLIMVRGVKWTDLTAVIPALEKLERIRLG